MRKWLLLVGLVLLGALPARGQSGYTVVSATVLDPFNVPYANCTWSAGFVDPGTSGKTPLVNGSIFARTFQGNCDSFAFMTVTLPDNNVIASSSGAVGTTWAFHFCAKSSPVTGTPTAPCFDVLPTLTITGASMNISAQVKASAAPLPSSGGTIGGTITQHQVAVGSGVNIIAGAATLTSPDNSTLYIGGPEPWASAKANGATCNGIADDSTSLNSTWTSVGATGNEMRVEDNCTWTTPSLPQPTDWVTLHLRGRLNLGSTLTLNAFTQLVGDWPQRAGNQEFQLAPMSNIQGFGATSPVITVAGQGVRFSNITVGPGGAVTGIGVQTNDVPATVFDGISILGQGASAQPLIINGSFGTRIYRSQFDSHDGSNGGTQPCVQLLDNSGTSDTIRYTWLNDVFCAHQGMLIGGAAGTYGGPRDGFFFDNYLYESSTGANFADAITTDTTNNSVADLYMRGIYVADSSACILNTGSAASGQNRLGGVEIILPIGGGCVKGSENITNLFAHTSQHVSTLFPSGSPQWSGLVLADGFAWISSPVYTMSSNAGATIINNPALQLFPNDTSGTGSFAFRLNKITSTGQTKVLATGDIAASPTLPSTGINPGTTGFNYIPIGGAFHCKGDNSSVTIGSLLTISSTAEGDGNGGDCHSLESTAWPTTDVSVIGILQNNSSGDYTVLPVLAQHGSARTNIATTWTANLGINGGIFSMAPLSDQACAAAQYFLQASTATSDWKKCANGVLSTFGSGGGTPCTTTALSVQFNNGGAFGCIPDVTFSTPHTMLFGAAGILDLSATAPTAGLKLPSLAGAVPTADGFIGVNTTLHALVTGSNGTTIVQAAAGTGTTGSTTCTNQVFTVISSVAAPTCTTLTSAFLPAAVVYNNQANTYTTGLQDFTAATMEIPEATGFVATVNSTLGLDTTANSIHGWISNADSILAAFVGAPTGSKCLQSAGSTGLISEATLACSTFVQPMTTLGDIIFENVTPTPTRLAGCTLAIGVPCSLTSTPTSGPTAAAPVWNLPGVPVNNNTETTCAAQTLNILDRASAIFCSGTTTSTFTFPVHTTSGFGASFPMVIVNNNTGTMTLTPTTDTIDTAALLAKWADFLYNNSSGNWQTIQVPTFSSFGVTCANALTWSTTTGFGCSGALGGSPALSAVTASGANTTIANANFTETWTSAQTTDAQDAFGLNEASAATGGTLTNALANQAEFHVQTASGSTATPVEIEQLSVTGATGPPLLQLESTWNNASLVGEGILMNVTNTSSAAGSKLLDLRVGNTAQVTVDKAGNGVLATSLGTGTPPTCTAGTAGTWCATEGTAFTNVASTAGIYPDSTQHEFMAATNGASTATPGMMVRSQPSPVHLTGQTASKGTTTLCAASAGACNVTGQYHIHADFIETGTACSVVTAGGVTLTILWTDTNGTAHSHVIVLMGEGAVATTPAMNQSFFFQTSLANAFASGDLNISTNGTVIQYATTYTACTTGTGTYQLDLAATRLQ